MRDRIWAALCNIEFKRFIIEMLYKKFQNLDRNVNIFLAIASSTSIAGWAIWDQYAFVWGLIIAGSQIITVIKPYFPHYKYVKEMSEKLIRMDSLSLRFEKLWDKIQFDKCSIDDAAEEYYLLKGEANEILSFSDDTIFEVSKKMEKKANEKMATFLENTYQIKNIIKIMNDG